MNCSGNEEYPDVQHSGEAERRAIDAALNFLAYRQRTEQEVRRKLVGRGFSEETVESALSRLRTVGLVDDASFVGAYVRDRIAHRPMGVRRMAQELRLRGVPQQVARPLIAEILADEGVDERELAGRILAKKWRTLSRREGDPALLRRRLRDHLIRRGFDAQLARGLVDEAISERDSGE